MLSEIFSVVGWDVGGVNIKAVRLVWQENAMVESRVVVRAFEIWRERENLFSILTEIGDELGVSGARAMALTMTAELSDTFRSKREGVLSILDAVSQVFPEYQPIP